MAQKIIILKLEEPKKHSGKYVVDGSQDDQYPNYMYLKKEWFPNKNLPKTVRATFDIIFD
jgi:hypothetical protein